ncbi:hypothetical protein [Comamonas resistens]|uniref:hypothetical protein n=1 Tax=Comamonas resistens TaxID=3046670 RepID=UPI0039BD75B6
MNAPLRNALVMLPQPAAEPQPLLPGAVELLRITGEEWFPPFPGYRVVQLLENLLSIVKDKQIPMHTSKAAMRAFAELDVILRDAADLEDRKKDRTAPPSNAVRAKLYSLRKEFRRKTGRGYIDAENSEWHAMPMRIRMALLLLCGIDGDLDALAGRDFQAMPPPERKAIKTEVRLAKNHFAGVRALASVW